MQLRQLGSSLRALKLAGMLWFFAAVTVAVACWPEATARHAAPRHGRARHGTPRQGGVRRNALVKRTGRGVARRGVAWVFSRNMRWRTLAAVLGGARRGGVLPCLHSRPYKVNTNARNYDDRYPCVPSRAEPSRAEPSRAELSQSICSFHITLDELIINGAQN